MTRNSELLRQIADQIEAEPSSYDQAVWRCGSCHCVAGWAAALSGLKPDENGNTWWPDASGNKRRIDKVAEELLGLTSSEAIYLFSPYWRPKDPEESIPHALRRYAEGDPIDSGAWDDD